PTLLRPELVHQHSQQAGLATAVRSHDGDPLPRADAEGGHLEQLAFAVADPQPVALEDQLAGRGGLELDPDLLVGRGRLEALQPVESGLPAARLSRPLPGLVAPDELLGPGHELPPRLVLLLAQRPPLL